MTVTILTNNRETQLFGNDLRYVSELVEVEDQDPIPVIFVEFTALNGVSSGNTQRIPLGKVDAIIQNS